MRSPTTLILLSIILGAFLVRLIGINYGLPFTYHDDEPIIVNYALAYGSGDFHPHVFKISPGLSYILFIFYGILFVGGRVLGAFKNVADFAYLYLTDPSIFYLIARSLFGLVCGTASVIAIYLVAKRYFTTSVGFLSAFFLAFNFLHVRDSHYVYFDIPLTLCVLLFFIKAADFFTPLERVSKRANPRAVANCNGSSLLTGFTISRKRDYLQLGALFGLATSVKYSGVFLIVPAIALILYNFFISKDKKALTKLVELVIFVCAALSVLFILNPFSFINFREFLRSATHLPVISPPPHYHLYVSLVHGCGGLVIALGILGMLWAVGVKRNKQLILILYALVYYYTISKRSQLGERLVLPLVPIIILFCSSVLSDCAALVKNKRVALSLSVALAFFLSIPSLIKVYYVDYLFLQQDTRTQAYHWIKAHIPADSRIGLDAISSWFPRLEKSRLQLKEPAQERRRPSFRKPKGADELKLRFLLKNPHYPAITYYLFYLKSEESLGRGFFSVYPDIAFAEAGLKANRIQYVVLSRALFKANHRAFVEAMETNSKLLKTFSPYKDLEKLIPEEFSLPPAAAFTLKELKSRTRFGPLIKIYELK